MVRTVEKVLSMRPRHVGRAVQVFCDTAALAAAFFLAYQLRFDFSVPLSHRGVVLLQLAWVVPVQLAALWFFGVHRFVWRYVGLAEVRSFLAPLLAATVPFFATRFFAPAALSALRIPLSVIILDALLAFTAVLTLRVARRVIHEGSERRRHAVAGSGTPVLLIGAGQCGVLAARELIRRGDAGIHIRGFVDDDPAKKHATIQGIPVLGTTAELPELVKTHGIDHVIITIAQAPRATIQALVAKCAAIPVKARIVPGMYEILGGSVEVSRIRNVEIEDLLGRDPVRLDEEAIRGLVTNRTVMVTGAGGSIGSELARQVARFNPATLLLVERAEFALFDIDRELRQQNPDFTIHPLVADTSDEMRMRRIFARHRPDVVIHAAAHKHVPMMELQPSEAIKNNTLPTLLLGHLAGEFGADAFVLISTDKAVNPTSVMGASKRVAELVIQDLSQHDYCTRFIGVRFGNVMGSAGSVIPIFRRQIEAGGPVTVTHPEMTRYFMTIPEASQLVLQAGAIGTGGEILVLDMGEPVKIVDLATQMIELSGLRPNEDIEIVFSGMRPGEKLFEELDRTGETLSKTKHPKIFNGNLTPYPRRELQEFVDRLRSAAQKGRDVEVRQLLSSMLPEAMLDAPKAEDDVFVPGLAPVAADGPVRLRVKEPVPAPAGDTPNRPSSDVIHA